MSTPINMIRRDPLMSAETNSPSPPNFLADNNNSVFPDTNELMRQQFMQQSTGQQPQQQLPQNGINSSMMMNTMQPMQQNMQSQMSNQSQNDGIMRSDSQLVEDILKEMGESPGATSQSDINSQAYQYATASSQIPPHKYIDPNATKELQNNSQYSGDNFTGKSPENNSKSGGFLNQISFSLSGENLKNKLIKNFKYPIVVFVICFILGLPEFNRFLFGFFPKLLLESGQVSISGVALKSLVGMIIFIVIAIFM